MAHFFLLFFTQFICYLFWAFRSSDFAIQVAFPTKDKTRHNIFSPQTYSGYVQECLTFLWKLIMKCPEYRFGFGPCIRGSYLGFLESKQYLNFNCLFLLYKANRWSKDQKPGWTLQPYLYVKIWGKLFFICGHSTLFLQSNCIE